MDMHNIAAIVTGGASGLGKATATILAAHGARVAILDLKEAAASAAAQCLKKIKLDLKKASPQKCIKTGINAVSALLARRRRTFLRYFRCSGNFPLICV